MNFGYLSILFTSLWGNSNSQRIKYYTKRRMLRNVYRLVCSLLGIAFFAYMLAKVYEVPVYYTKLDAAFLRCKLVDGSVNISIIRNFDRSDKQSAPSDSIGMFLDQMKWDGCIYICGECVTDFDQVPHETTPLEKEMCQIYPTLLDTVNITSKDNPAVMRMKLYSSNRQEFKPHCHRKRSKSSYCQDKENEKSPSSDSLYDIRIVNTNTFFDGRHFWKKDYRPHHLFEHNELKYLLTDNGFYDDTYWVATEPCDTFGFSFNITGTPFGKPTLLAAEDVSKMVEIVSLPSLHNADSLQADSTSIVKSLTIDYRGPVDFSEAILPVPDEKTLSSIRYTNREKIRQIERDGLRFHCRFPDMENIQEARIFVLSGVLTGLAALALKYLWRLWNDSIRCYKRRYRRCHLKYIIPVALCLLGYILYWIIKVFFYEAVVHPFDL